MSRTERTDAVFQQLSPQDHPVTLVFYAAGVNIEAINLLLSGIACELMMTDSLDLAEKITLTFVENLHPLQWKVLLPHFTGRLVLGEENSSCENGDAIATFPKALITGCGIADG